MSEKDFEEPPIRFTDNRKIDREAAETAAAADEDPAAGPPIDETLAASDAVATDENARLLEERTRDLQRLSAEYANYRRRAERERAAAGEIAIGRTLTELLPVVDDLDRARAHGDLSGALKAVADKLDAAFGKLGLVAVGAEGDVFDPQLHEAVMHDESDEVSRPTVSTVMRAGFKHGERLLRPAMVGVTDPTHPAPPTSEQATEAVQEPDSEPQPEGSQPPA